MNLQQLEYIVAVDTHRHFEKAADHCFVTQATLSAMIKKLEQELDVVIFDRSKQPVVPTEVGKSILEQARVVLRESTILKQLSKTAKTGLQGSLKIGIIPTLAPYLLPLFLMDFLKKYPAIKLLPLFLMDFLKKYPAIKLKIVEQTTEHLLHLLATDKLDVGIMATPLTEKGFLEKHLFYEEFKVYVSAENKSLKKKYILAEDIDISKLWLLEEGHCLRSQVLNLCEIQKQQALAHHLDYETGSIESLLRITEINGGITIVPNLATLQFTRDKTNCLRHFKPPVPVREISLVTYRHFVKKGLLNLLEKEILKAVKPYVNAKAETDIISIA
ncbi:MAG: hydrogen peroxide-inducible genes activator [Chitinophagaceae bacterium]|nr:MAG: hydrogen peroxide-inducible genes activator [Chitinophagaceae bacterium]